MGYGGEHRVRSGEEECKISLLCLVCYRLSLLESKWGQSLLIGILDRRSGVCALRYSDRIYSDATGLIVR